MFNLPFWQQLRFELVFQKSIHSGAKVFPYLSVVLTTWNNSLELVNIVISLVTCFQIIYESVE